MKRKIELNNIYCRCYLCITVEKAEMKPLKEKEGLKTTIEGKD